MVGRATEIAKGIVTGSAPNVNKLRELTEEELDQCMWQLPLTMLSSIWSLMDSFAHILFRAPTELVGSTVQSPLAAV